MNKLLLCASFFFALFIFTATTAVAAPSANWQLAYKDNDVSFYFDTNTTKTIGSSDILSVELKTVIPSDIRQTLIARYKSNYDTSKWQQIQYCIASTVYNQKDKSLLIKNQRFYDASNNLVATISTEDKLTVAPDSVQSKVYSAIFEWLYEN